MQTTTRLTSNPARARAMFGMVASVMLGIAALVVFTFAQVFPALVMLGIAIVGMIASGAALWAIKHVQARDPVEGAPHAP